MKLTGSVMSILFIICVVQVSDAKKHVEWNLAQQHSSSLPRTVDGRSRLFKSINKVSLLNNISYSFAATAGTFESIASDPEAMDVLSDTDDDVTNVIPIGFNFFFAGRIFSDVVISSNGWISFNDQTISTANGYGSPNTLVVDPDLFPYVTPLFGDLFLNGSIYCKTSGAAQNRTFTVEWNNVAADYSYSPSNSLSFQVIFYESTHEIQFVYSPGPDAATTFDNPSNSGLAAGIVDEDSNFVSITELNTSASADTTVETDTLFSPPSEGLTFTFAPGAGLAPSYVEHRQQTNVNETSAALHGVVFVPGGSNTVARFLWGTSSGIYTDSIEASQSPLSGTTIHEVSQTVSSLSAGTKYYVALSLENSNEYHRSSEEVLMTFSPLPGNALKFNAGGDVAGTSTTLLLKSDSLTLEAMVKWNGTSGFDQFILYNGNEDNNNNGCGIIIDESTHKVCALLGGVGKLHSNFVMPTDVWTHLALVNVEGIWTLYVNGDTAAFDEGGSFTANPLFNFNVFTVGLGGHSFKGIVDEVRVWNIPRSVSEIRNDMNISYSTGQTGLIGYWQFNEGSGSNVYDLAGKHDLSLGAFSFDETDGWVSSNAPLPVELTSLKVIVNGLAAELHWTTASETKNYGFEIERAMNNGQLTLNTWKKIGFVDGNGTTNSQKEYSYTDNELIEGKYLYRLKQIDQDGKFKYSQEIEAIISSVPKVFSLEQNYPNPFNPNTVIRYHIPMHSHVSLTVFDAIGRQISRLTDGEQDAGMHTVQFDGTQYSGGVYFVRLQTADGIQIKKMTLLK